MRKLLRFANPINRTAVVVFAWAHRHEIKRWGRSIWTELTRGATIEPKRLATLAKVLWAITSDGELSKSPKLRRVRLDGDTVVVDMDRRWKHAERLVERLEEIEGVAAVRREDGPPIDATSRVVPFGRAS